MPEAPYYESRYIRANHPDQPQALWLRETLLLPTAGDPVADVWVMVFDPEGEGNRALKQPYPIDAADYAYDNWTARIGATSIDDRSAQGVVTGGNRSARWDLRITPGSEQPVKLLTERAYKARIPTAKTTVRHPLAQFDGQLELDDARLVLDGWTGSVNHNWGRGTPRPTRSAKCAASTTRRTRAWRSSPRTRRSARCYCLRPRCSCSATPVRNSRFARFSPACSTHGDYQPFSWSFGARVGGPDDRGGNHRGAS